MKLITTNNVLELKPLSLSSRENAAISEDWLQQLIFAHPDLLPVDEIDPIFGQLHSLCREAPTPAGPVDNLYINELGMLTIAECKLWRNPQARREVIGQILDYAAQISRWNYVDLEQAIGSARGEPDFSLYRFLRRQDVKTGQEAVFIDNVNRNLRRGRFLLLIVGDGIRERVEAIGDFLQNQAHLNFSFALVEIGLYQLPEAKGGALLVAPRVLVRTVEIERTVVRLEDGRLVAEASSRQPTSTKTSGRGSSITEQYFYEQLNRIDPELAAQTEKFLEQIQQLGLVIDPTKSALMIKTQDKEFNFAALQPDGSMRNYGIAAKTEALGLGNLGELYLEQLAALLPEAEVNRTQNRFDWTVQNRDGSPVLIADGLAVQDEWLALIKETLRKIEDATARKDQP